MSEQEKIDRRLLNQMSKAEQDAFDGELTDNSDLADSFEINQDMADFFANENPDLEGKLDVLGDKYFSDNSFKKKKRSWFWLIPILLMTGGGIFYFLFDTSETISTILDKTKTESPTTPPLIDTKIEGLDTEKIPAQEKEEVNDKQKKEEKPDFNVPTSESKSQPIAALNPADFEVNPILEGLMRENVRDVNVTTLNSPLNEAILQSSSELFSVIGSTNIKPPYQLTIYSNRIFDFDNDYPILRREISGSRNIDNFSFNTKVKAKFKPGLYYLLLQNEQSELMNISKFTVR
ncbi:MAG: hypothetical protein ACI85O_003532 [Saprospiraceae bacterium]|jgi:hypothetical protein